MDADSPSHAFEASSSIEIFDNSTSIPEYNHLRSTNYDQQSYEIISDAPTHSVVKWFNPRRGFGFVELSDGSGEAFIHQNVLARSGIDAVERCAVLEVRVVRGNRGPRVVEVLSVDSSGAVPATKRRPKTRLNAPPVEEIGTVKSYKENRGYGFIARDGGGRDVFVHASALKRRKIPGLSEGQRVVMEVIEGRKGPKATSVRLVLAALGYGRKR